jgi:phosphonate transport system substrate-binding protein
MRLFVNLESARSSWTFLLLALLFLLLPLSGGDAIAGGSKALSVGIFPRRDSEVTRRMFQPLLEYLQQKLAVQVTHEVPPDFDAFWQRLGQRRYDLVHLNQYQYLRAHRWLGYEAILKNQEMGSSEISSVVWVRKDSGIRRPEQLRGQKIIFGGGRQAMVSYIMAVDLLRNQGLSEGDYLVQIAVNPVSALYSLYFGQSRAAGAGDVLPELMVLKGRDDLRNELLPLLSSRPVAQLPWAVNPRLSQATIHDIQQTLSQLHLTWRGRRLLSHAGLTGLAPATDKEYDPHRKIVARVLREHY